MCAEMKRESLGAYLKASHIEDGDTERGSRREMQGEARRGIRGMKFGHRCINLGMKRRKEEEVGSGPWELGLVARVSHSTRCSAA